MRLFEAFSSKGFSEGVSRHLVSMRLFLSAGSSVDVAMIIARLFFRKIKTFSCCRARVWIVEVTLFEITLGFFIRNSIFSRKSSKLIFEFGFTLGYTFSGANLVTNSTISSYDKCEE